MSSRASWTILSAIAEPIGKHIRSGRTLPVCLGTLLGAAIGATAGLINVVYIVPAVIAAGLVGAGIAASIFWRPPAAAAENLRLGRVIRVWKYCFEKHEHYTVLLEHTLFRFRTEEPETLAHVINQLQAGREPTIEGGSWVSLRSLSHLYARVQKDYIIGAHWRAGRRRRLEFVFHSALERDEFLALLLEYCPPPRCDAVQDMSFERMVRIPLIVGCILCAVTIAIAWLANDWRAHPPRNPVGKNRPDELVALLRWAGPQGVAIAGALALLVPITWLVLRFYSPPRERVIRFQPESAGRASHKRRHGNGSDDAVS